MCHVFGSYLHIVLFPLEVDVNAVDEDAQHDNRDFVVVEHCYNHV